MPSSRSQSGLSLVELLIVLVVIAIIVTIALPNLLSARISTYESAAIKTMHQILEAQVHFATAKAADEDLNGVGEHGTFGELAGSVAVRAAAGGTDFLDPSLISPAFRVITPAGEMCRSGYYFKIFLPDSLGNGVGELPGGGASALVDPNLCEGMWCAYAWPQKYEATGRRSFFTNQSGSILFTEDATYSGASAPISPGAAYAPPGSPAQIDGTAVVNGTGRDGNVWRPAGN